MIRRLAQLEQNFHRLLLLGLIYLIPAFQGLLPVEDPDIWWHLRTGEWILEHGRVPATDPFSSYGAGKPWVAYSWLFDVTVYTAYKTFGLVGIVWVTVALASLIALALHIWVRQANLPLVFEVALLALALSGIKPLYSPRPWLFSILFFALEVNVLFHVRRSGNLFPLAVLPPLFALWANLHIQFVYGLAVLMIFAVEPLVNRLSPAHAVRENSLSMSPGLIFVVSLSCLGATFLNPYHIRVFLPFLEHASLTAAFDFVRELQPMSFRSPSDWFVLALGLTAAYGLGRREPLGFFPVLVFAMSVVLSFRAMRDVWVLVITATALISEAFRSPATSASFKLSKAQTASIIVGVVGSVYLMSFYRGITESNLALNVERRFPVKAADFVNRNTFPGPLYNDFDWGGYLIWALPKLPVTMDGRGNLHGNQRLVRSFATWAGSPEWESDSELKQSRLIIADVTRPLTSILARDPRFRVVYQDDIAIVFIRSDSDF